MLRAVRSGVHHLLIGFTGLLSFGRAMFLATAGYVTGYAIQTIIFTPELGVVAGTLAATVLGIVVGLLAIHRQGIYFAMVTLALAQMLYFVFLQAPFTHGEDGLQGVPRGTLFGLIDLNGGMSTMFGPLLSAFIIVLLEDRPGDIGGGFAKLTGIGWFNSLGESVTIVTDVIFIACVLAFRRGIAGKSSRVSGRFRVNADCW